MPPWFTGENNWKYSPNPLSHDAYIYLPARGGRGHDAAVMGTCFSKTREEGEKKNREEQRERRLQAEGDWDDLPENVRGASLDAIHDLIKTPRGTPEMRAPPKQPPWVTKAAKETTASNR